MSLRSKQTGEEPSLCVKSLSLSDADFYVIEYKALQALEELKGNKTIAEVCRELNIDQYDFKDRWGSLLRHNSPNEVLAKVAAVKKLIGAPMADIAKSLNYSMGTVRTIVKKLLVRPESNHIRSKENMAHRIMYSTGGSLKEAKEKLGRRRKSSKRNNSTEDSMSSDYSDYSDLDELISNKRSPGVVEKTKPLRVEATDIPPVRLTPAPVIKSEGGLFEQIIVLVDDIDPWLAEDISGFINPKAQLLTLKRVSENTDLQNACAILDLDLSLMTKMWKRVLDLFPGPRLAAYVYAVVVLHRLGYGCTVISDALSVAKLVVSLTLWNLHLGVGPSHGRSFDIAVSLLRKGGTTRQRIVEICGIPLDVASCMIERIGAKEQLLARLKTSLVEVSAPSKVLWLYERGLSVSVICAVLKLTEGVVAAACQEDA